MNELLKKDPSYAPHQQELEFYRKHGINEYVFLGDGCDICTALNGKTFLIEDAEIGVNFPPIHLKCKCTIKAKAKIDLFKDRKNVNPLKNNPKFEEWIKKQQNNSV